jgi:hypothetical protein
VKDVFVHGLAKGAERGNPLDWVKFNIDVSQLSPDGMLHAYPQLPQAIARIDGDAQANAQQIYGMYQRNADDVKTALLIKQNQHHDALLAGKLPSDCLLRLIGSGIHLRPRIIECLEDLEAVLVPQLKMSFRRNHPANERQLQDQAEVILRAAGYAPWRELPEFAFCIVGTKPDFSFPESETFLEMKLLDDSTERTKVVDGILADIEKYGRKCQGVLFVIYQTRPFIADPGQFAREISTDPTVRIAVIG